MTMNQEREVDVMRYVDGEMDGAERGVFETLMAADDALRAAVERERALRQMLQGTYAPVVEEPVPDRLMAALAALAARRAEAQEEAPSVASLDAARGRRRGMPTWATLGGMAASVMLGLVLGDQLHTLPPLIVVPEAGTGIRAQGELAEALSMKLSGERLGRVSVGLSFKSREGGYCRSFSYDNSAGLACHSVGAWRLRQVMPAPAAQAGEYRTAATALPPALLQAMDEMREGDVLDAKQEAEAKAKGWR